MKRGFIAAVTVAVALGGIAHAGIIAEETFETAGDLRDWDLVPVVDPSGTATLTAPSGMLNPSTPAASLNLSDGVLGTPELDQVSISTPGDPSGLIGTGDWVSDGTDFVQFDFYLDANADAAGFNQLTFFFVGGGDTWYYQVDVSGQTGGNWATYSVPFSGSTGWTTTSVDPFTTDVASVSSFGFEVSYVTGATQTYGFDNVRRGFTVPEPETYAAIGFALVALAMAFRKQLTDMLAVVRVPSVL
jgi:hypothetical protein